LCLKADCIRFEVETNLRSMQKWRSVQVGPKRSRLKRPLASETRYEFANAHRYSRAMNISLGLIARHVCWMLYSAQAQRI